jgi:uroporphyrinogen-III synthase
MHLLVTRPEPDAERTAARLRQQGHQVTVAPVLRLETMPEAAFGAGPFAALVMTSGNAARVILGHDRRDELLGLPVFTVGRQTAEAARAAGFSTAASADGGFPELVRLIAAKLRVGQARLLYLAAEDRSGDLARALAPHGIDVETVVIYRTVSSPTLPQDLRAALSDRLDGVLHYSRRSAQSFLLGAGTAGRLDAAVKLTHYCLSSEIAAPLRAAGATQVRIAPRPEEAALIELLSASG